MGRVVMHIDANHYYAAIEELYDPDLRKVPLAICGDPTARHGIVLTKNPIAKRFGVQTGEAIWQAKQKCPGLVVRQADIELYLRFTQVLREIYSDYSDLVENFGLDEAWVDVSAPDLTIADARPLADSIRERVKHQVGISVSIGVSFNKVFAKFGSDLKKPDATSVITEENYRDVVWPRPVSELLFVGPKTTEKLRMYSIRTIGDLAHADDELLHYKLGKVGGMLKAYALGWDNAPVCPQVLEVPIKSVGNSTTAPHDIETLDDAKVILYLLSESVGTRLREHGFRSKCVSISVRTTDLVCYSCQRVMPHASNLTGEIAKMALTLFTERYVDRMPFRSLGVHCQSLVPESAPEQLDVFGDCVQREKMLCLDKAIDNLKERFGPTAVYRGIVAADAQYRRVRPESHIQPSMPFFGR